MLENEDIVYFANDYRPQHRTSTHHIAQRLARRNRVLYVEAGGLRTPERTKYDLNRVVGKLRDFGRGLRQVDSSLWVGTPLVVPKHSSPVARYLNKGLLRCIIRHYTRSLGFDHPIIWSTVPHMVAVLGSLNEKLSVYYCTDEYTAWPGVDPVAVRLLDEAMARNVDVVFAASERVLERKKKLNPSSFLSPHGVDVLHFGKALSGELTPPDDIRNIRRPIVGYFGLMERWTDLELVKHIALSRPDWSVVMIGRVAQAIDGFKEVRNVHFLGSKAFESLPAYGQMFDVAILPYIRNEQVLSANPLKLREYLAMGKPVVSVSTPEVVKFSNVVYMADTHNDFVDSIATAIREDSKERIRDRIRSVEDSSWDSRLENVSAIVQKVLEKRKTSDPLRAGRRGQVSPVGERT